MPASLAGAITQAALSGASAEELVERAARTLQEAADADRVGVWLIQQHSADLKGQVLERRRAAVPAEWAHLDRSAPGMEELLGASGAVVVDLSKIPRSTSPPPVTGMRTAVWMALHMGEEPLGLVLVAYRWSRLRQEAAVLRALADELALAVTAAHVGGDLRGREHAMRAQMLQTEKLAALGQLVSGIAHELNNPLTSIMGYAQLLLGHRPGPDTMTNVHHLYQEAERARRIVQNLLLFARETRPERRPTDLNEIVERTLALRSYELKVENIAVTLDLAPNLPRLLADAHQLQQVLLNLLVNAEQAILGMLPEATPPDGRGRVRITTRLLPGDRVALEVADDGPGIPPEVVSRVFDPFFTTKPMGQGTGLGLSIAYGIVQEHGGEIYVENQPAAALLSGARFVVELPVALVGRAIAPGRAEKTGAARAHDEMGHAGSQAHTGRRILVIEDEPTVAQLLADVLGEEGHQVEKVLDSREGLRRALRQAYDLAICDLRMPGLDGRAIYDALVSANSPLCKRLILITGDTLAPRTLEFLEKTGLPYVGKPFLVEELKSVVRDALEIPTRQAADATDTEATRASRQKNSRVPADDFIRDAIGKQ